MEELFATTFTSVFVFRLVAVTFIEWAIFSSYIRARIRNKHSQEREEHAIPVPAPHQKLNGPPDTSRDAL